MNSLNDVYISTSTTEARKPGERSPLHGTKGAGGQSRNAVRHGLLARGAVLPGKDADDFESSGIRFGQSSRRSSRLRNLSWNAWSTRVEASTRAETALFHWRASCLKAIRLREQVRSYEKSVIEAPSFSIITDKASHSEATEALAEAEAERDRDEVLLGCAFDADAKKGNTLAKLAGYETRHERSLFRKLNELRKMQEKRQSRR